jgi:hypothetical protein
MQALQPMQRSELKSTTPSSRLYSDRADRDARREFAVIAPHHAEQPAIVRKFALLDVLDPGAIDAERHLMLTFTGDGAGVTTDAFAVVD